MKLLHKTNRKFITTGLFRYCRHPNYFCELSLWFIIAWFANDWECFAGWTLLLGIFLGSTLLTEYISESKYKDYAEYKKHTSMLIPWV